MRGDRQKQDLWAGQYLHIKKTYPGGGIFLWLNERQNTEEILSSNYISEILLVFGCFVRQVPPIAQEKLKGILPPYNREANHIQCEVQVELSAVHRPCNLVPNHTPDRRKGGKGDSQCPYIQSNVNTGWAPSPLLRLLPVLAGLLFLLNLASMMTAKNSLINLLFIQMRTF